MIRRNLIVAVFASLLGADALLAQSSVEKILPLDGRIEAAGSAVELNWFAAKPPRLGSVTVKRRLYGQTGGATWQVLAPALGPVLRFTDDTIKPGVAYEYQVLRSARDIVDVGYWVTGVGLPAVERRGNAYVIVDQTIAEAIAPRLARFESDLIGDGWLPQRHLVARDNKDVPFENLKKALDLRRWLIERFAEDPFGQHAVILIGNVPIVRSGSINPDGHKREAHATDLFYADMDGRWTGTRDGVLMDNRVPGDFIEMQIGRVDFSNVSGGERETEIRLLRAYFDKNHHWRMAMVGDLREAYGQIGHLNVELYGLGNIVGPTAVAEGGHHDVGELQPWLWGVASGDWNGNVYAEKYASKAVFALNFGSGKQKFDGRFGPMTALLAQPWYPLAVGWGARPAWWLHHMALGGTIGDVHLRTVNNGSASKPYRETMDYYPTGRYLWRNPVWVNLLGDPTLRAFMLRPVPRAVARKTDQGTVLSWTAPADTDVIGYRVYRARPGSLTFEVLDGARLVEDTQFTDPDGENGARYMVRAYGLKRVHAGSFHTLSQGIFVDPEAEVDFVKDFTVSAVPSQTVVLPKEFNSVTDGRIFAFVEGPSVGHLGHDGTDWLYTPPAGFAGQVTLRFSVSNAWTTDEGLLAIRVGD